MEVVPGDDEVRLVDLAIGAPVLVARLQLEHERAHSMHDVFMLCVECRGVLGAERKRDVHDVALR